MKRKCVILGMALLLMLWFLVGCGVSQEQYYTAVSERDITNVELQSVKTQLEGVEAEIKLVNTELEKAETELLAVKTELDDSKAELQSTQIELQIVQTKLEDNNDELQSISDELEDCQQTIQDYEKAMVEAKTFADLLSSTFVPPLKGEVITEAELAKLGIDVLRKLEALDDEKAQRLVDDWIESGFADQEGTDLFIYIFETLPEILYIYTSYNIGDV